MAAGRALGCSVNDVLLSCVAGALRGYLRDHGDPIDGVELRALVPVNLRRGGQTHTQTLGNRFGLVALVLPVWVENPLARLYEVGQRMLDLKGSHQAAVTLGVLAMVGLCPKPVQQQILDMLANKATAVMTNVPGPQNHICDLSCSVHTGDSAQPSVWRRWFGHPDGLYPIRTP